MYSKNVVNKKGSRKHARTHTISHPWNSLLRSRFKNGRNPFANVLPSRNTKGSADHKSRKRWLLLLNRNLVFTPLPSLSPCTALLLSTCHCHFKYPQSYLSILVLITISLTRSYYLEADLAAYKFFFFKLWNCAPPSPVYVLFIFFSQSFEIIYCAHLEKLTCNGDNIILLYLTNNTITCEKDTSRVIVLKWYPCMRVFLVPTLVLMCTMDTVGDSHYCKETAKGNKHA